MRKGGHAEVYGYRWDWDEEPTKGGADLSGMIGAAHGLEIPFVFGHFQMGPLNILFTEENRAGREELSRAMMSYWANFAKTGDPNCAAIPRWEPYGLPRRQTMVFDVPSRLADDPRDAERRLFAKVPFVPPSASLMLHVPLIDPPSLESQPR